MKLFLALILVVGAASANEALRGTATAKEDFLSMTPVRLLSYQKSKCGKAWPKECNADGKTDGFLCNSHTGHIADMTIYKNEFKGSNTFPAGAGSKTRARCVKDKCASKGTDIGDQEILTISQIGAKICAWGMGDKATIKVKGEKITATVIKSKDESKPEDISVKLAIPLALCAFNPFSGGSSVAQATKLIDEKGAKEAIAAAFKALGAIETATAVKTCGHGFTNAKTADGQPIKPGEAGPDLVQVLKGRAGVMAQASKDCDATNKKVTVGKPSIHNCYAPGQPVGGIILKLNGAAKTPCVADDWKGSPLEEATTPAQEGARFQATIH
jgi:hypothetical protein